MPTNIFFNNYGAANEQSLIEDLIVESIRQQGVDVYYLPRRMPNYNSILGEDATQYFDRAYMVEMYIENIEGFGGDGDFYSSFGLEIRDQMIFSMARRAFKQHVDSFENDTLIRPREGDLIYFPLNKKCFQIKYTTDKPVFYQLGTLHIFKMTCELFEYSQEEFNTGIEEIDVLQKLYSSDILDYAMLSANGEVLESTSGDILTADDFDLSEINIFADNEEIEEESDEILDLSEVNIFGSEKENANTG